MTLHVIEEVGKRTAMIPEAVKPAIQGSVQAVQRNYAELTGINRGRKFFYRETEASDYRKTLLQRTSQLYFSVAFASRKGGDLLERELQSWFELRSALQDGIVIRPRDFWEVEEDTNALLSEVRKSVLKANAVEARFYLVQIRQKVDEMLRLIDSMPMAVK